MNYGAPKNLAPIGAHNLHQNCSTLWRYGEYNVDSNQSATHNPMVELRLQLKLLKVSSSTNNNGSINNDKTEIAVMQYCNTPLPAISLSPSQILFHREPCDLVSCLPIHYQLHKDWIITHEQRENKTAK